MTDIQKELLAMSGITAKKSEKRQDFLVRLITKTQEVADKDEAKWDELPEDAQNWINAATAEMKKEQEITDFDGADEDDEEEERAVAKKKKKKAAAAAEDDEEEATEEGEEEE